MCINSKITREEFFGDSIVVWCATILLVKLFSAFTLRKETSETTCEIPSSSRRCFRIGTGIHADPEKKRSAKRERYHADPEKKRSAKRQCYEADQQRNRPKNASGIMQTQKRNGQLKGNVIGRVLNVLAWRRECGTGRLSVPCKTNEAIEKELPTKLFKGM